MEGAKKQLLNEPDCWAGIVAGDLGGEVNAPKEFETDFFYSTSLISN